MRAFLESNQEPITLDLYDASSPHEALVGLLRFDLLITRQPSRQPAVATVCNHRQRHIKVNIEADFAGQAVEVDQGEVLEGRKPMKMSRYDGATGRRIAERTYAGI